MGRRLSRRQRRARQAKSRARKELLYGGDAWFLADLDARQAEERRLAAQAEKIARAKRQALREAEEALLRTRARHRLRLGL